MAKIGGITGVDYQADFEGTEKQGGSFELLPHMYARLQAESIELKETQDALGWQAAIAFEVVEPAEYANKKIFQYWTIVHAAGFTNGSYKYGKAKFDAFGRAIGVQIDAETDTDDLTFHSFVAEVDIEFGGPNKNKPGENYKDKNTIKRFFYTDADAKEPVPDIGVIAANDNTPQATPASRPASRPAQGAPAARPAAAPGTKPWGKRAA